MPRLAQSSRSAAGRGVESRPSNSWLPATNTTGCGQPRKRVERRASARRCRRRGRAARRPAPARGRTTRSRGAGPRGAAAASGEAPAAPWHCLNLLAAAARARVVAADLRRRAAHRLDLVAQRQRQVVELGDAGDDLPDRVVERVERQLARDQRARCPRSSSREEAEQARERGRDRGVVELVEAGQQVDRLLEAGDPGQQRAADRIERRDGSALRSRTRRG